MTTMPNETSMSNADRLRVQDTLRHLDYYKGQLDGVFGPLTRAAIRRFQGDIGAQVTGRLTAEEASRLVSTAPSAR
jgi:peptidoglycan hydrolase-like protein with peptidoglycan-binding domain